MFFFFVPAVKFWRKLNGKKYFVHVGGKSYAEAVDYCHSKKLKLVEPKSSKANKDIQLLAKSIATQGYGVWIGIDDKSIEGKFTYASDGESVKFTNWNRGQPDNAGGNEDCAHLWKGHGFRWNDVPCSARMSFVCESQSGKYVYPL